MASRVAATVPAASPPWLAEVRLPQGAKGSAVYGQLRRLIVLGRLPAGEPLVELQLAAAVGCSQGPVREALFRLQEDGLVQRAGYRGTFVSRTSSAEAEELVALRCRIEVQAARRALPSLTPSLLEDLATQIERMEELARHEDLYAMTEADRTFHLTLFREAGLPALEPILERCFLLIHRHAITRPERRRTPMEAASRHRSILAALRGGEEEAVMESLRLHICSVIDGASPLGAGGGPAA
ncbi:GntR family transcriptional regulator [Geminicoccaceae bacterium 1502E]|nr:GntR family transcriptional regulator [Geminicoccaceae bacterium 1502E]